MAFGFLKKAVRAAGKAGKGVGKGIGKVAKGTVKGVGKGVQGAAKGVGAVGKLAGKVPVVGKGLKGAFDLTVAAPFHVASDISKGKRIDKVAMGALQRHVTAVKDVAPYAQMVISNVPVVGQGASGAISAGLALASGQPITEAIAAGVKGALPGGPIAQSAFELGRAAATGKPLTTAMVNALPINAAQKKALASGMAAVRDVASGKKINEVLLNQGQSYLPPDVKKALNVGIAIGSGQRLQKIAPQTLKPTVVPKLKGLGALLVKSNPAFKAAGKILDANGKAGFQIGAGLMHQKKLRPIELTAVRAKLTPRERKGFDVAIAAKIGMTSKKLPKKATPAQALGFYTTAGLKGAGKKNKVAILKTVAAKPEIRSGAELAVRQEKAENSSWWRRILRYFGVIKDEAVSASTKPKTTPKAKAKPKAA